LVSKYFDHIEFKMQNREFTTHTGILNKKRLTVISTGIGTDNIDIFLNELDALVNIDLKERTIKKDKKSLTVVRIGTSGSLQGDVPVDSFVLSDYGLGLDGLLNFYKGHQQVIEKEITEAFIRHSNWNKNLAFPYIVKGSEDLIKKLESGCIKGITATASGFYAPQGRTLRLLPEINDLNEMLSSFSFENKRITNFEMETSALYGLSALLGHQACTVCAIIANRIEKQYSKDYKKTVDQLIQFVLGKLTN